MFETQKETRKNGKVKIEKKQPGKPPLASNTTPNPPAKN